jgi:glyoxylate reductase
MSSASASSTGKKVVVTGRIPQAGIEVLVGAGHQVIGWNEPGPITREELLRRVAGAHGIVTLLTEKVDQELLDAAGTQVQVVSNVAVGYNNLDVPTINARGAIATNTPGVLTEATADIAMALILMSTRRLAEGERLIRSGDAWQWGMFMMLGTSIQGRRLGIVGMGAIGAATARRAKAFGMDIAYSNRREVHPDLAAELGAVRLTMDELLATSDIVSIHCPYSPETHHLFNAETLAKMQPHAYLINTARGPIVDEAALVAALEMGALDGAGLDVFENEPTVHPGLLGRNDVVLIPHLGSATVETRTAMATLAARNTNAVLRGEPAISPIG